MSNAVTGLGAQFLIGPPVGSTGPFTLIGELANFNPNGREWDVLDVTNFQSNYDKEKIKGLREPGQFWLTGNRIDGDAGQNLLKTAFDDPQPYQMQIWVPASRGFSGGIVAGGVRYGEVWSISGLVLSIDPPVIAPGKALRFFSKIQATWRRHISTGWTNATGAITMFQSRPLGNPVNGAAWSNFSIPLLPSDAVIQGIYPVIIASATHDQAVSYYFYGVGASWGVSAPPSQFLYPSNPGSTTFTSTEFWAPSIGTSLSVLNGQDIVAELASSLFLNGMADVINVTGVGFAVYYTSAYATIDPQMSPPFTVPAGQGLAWSLPFGVAMTVGTGTGTAAATASVLN